MVGASAAASANGLRAMSASHSARVGAKIALSKANYSRHNAATVAIVLARLIRLRTMALPLLM